MAKASIFVSKAEYIDVSVNRYWVLCGSVVGSVDGIGRGSSGLREAIFSKSGSCWT